MTQAITFYHELAPGMMLRLAAGARSYQAHLGGHGDGLYLVVAFTSYKYAGKDVPAINVLNPDGTMSQWSLSVNSPVEILSYTVIE